MFRTPKKATKIRTVVSPGGVVNGDVELKKMLGILIVLLIVVFFTVFINIVITLMKPGCKCGQMLSPPMYWQPPPAY
jgi:hypothetical protein